MRVSRHDGVLAVTAARYTLSFPTDRPFVYLNDPCGTRLAELFILSGVHPLHGRDDTLHVDRPVVDETEDEVVISVRAQSSVWDEKLYRFRCRPNRFTYEVVLTGVGRLAEAHLFGGFYSGHVRWGSGFFTSGQQFQQGFNPEPNMDEVTCFSAAESSTIDLSGVPLPGRDHWFFTPPPFCFAFQAGQSWLSMGVEAAPGANRFSEYRYVGARGTFHLTLPYDGQTQVQGSYQLPAIGFDFGDDPYELLAVHARTLRQCGYAPQLDDKIRPLWWYEPIFCGWGAQCHLATVEDGAAPDYARQSLYEAFLETLDLEMLRPGIVVIDDKWQQTYGGNEVDTDKWPDLRGFIARQHAVGRKVLLWLKAWDPEGIPAAECITNAAGLPIAIDPTHPAFEQRLRAAVREMLAPDGYDADGFKIDFTARIPSGPHLQLHGDLWGLELMKRYLGIIYDEARQTKADALVMTHTPHPYLADVLDIIRLNDMNTDQDVSEAMRHRARVAGIACPSALIDTDNWPITDRAAWRTYLPLQAELGVPSLYYASHVDATSEPLEASDYELLRETWAAYRLRQRRRQQQDEEPATFSPPTAPL